MNIALMALKGGVGKSTGSVLLYEALKQAGKTVTINDWDPQGTSTKALALIDPDGQSKQPRPDIVIWDTPPNLEHTATATAVRQADIVLVMTTPAPADTWEAEDAVQFVKSRNSGAKIRLVFNKVKKNTVLGKLIEESAKQITVPTLPVTIGERECYKHAIARGWPSLDGPAREEILQFAVALLSLN